LVENPSKLNSSPNISRIKSLIKPPPPRTSWELLLDDYLKDPNFHSTLTEKLLPNNSPPYQQTTLPSSQYPFCIPCQTKSCLPPRRYEMTLDELVYLISQVGRSDLYREMVQYIKTTSNISSSHSITKPSNINAYSTERSTQSLLLNNNKKKTSNFSSEILDELILKK